MVRQCAVDEKYLHINLRAEAGAVKPIVDAVDALSLLMITQAAKYMWSPISSLQPSPACQNRRQRQYINSISNTSGVGFQEYPISLAERSYDHPQKSAYQDLGTWLFTFA
jgi:hypothetical protein